MKKTYKFEVTVNQGEDGDVNDFVKNLKDEVNEDARQLRITKAINKETTKVHLKILEDFAKELDDTFEALGIDVKCSPIRKIHTTNEYTTHEFSVKLSHRYEERVNYQIQIHANNDRDFKESKFCTYTGEYFIRLFYPTSGTLDIPQENDIVGTLLDSMRRNIKYMVEDLVTVK